MVESFDARVLRSIMRGHISQAEYTVSMRSPTCWCIKTGSRFIGYLEIRNDYLVIITTLQIDADPSKPIISYHWFELADPNCIELCLANLSHLKQLAKI